MAKKPKKSVGDALSLRDKVAEEEMIGWLLEGKGTSDDKLRYLGKLVGRMYPMVTNHLPSQIAELRQALAHQSKLLWLVLVSFFGFVITIVLEMVQR